jgi:predicted Fe-Mo cluster-binding NifX family protein
VGEDFGHAPFFLVVDADTLDYHVIENEFADSPEGAGVAVAKAITTLQPDAVITGGIGMHGLEILRKAGILVSYDEEGPIEQCITDFLRRHRNNAS